MILLICWLPLIALIRYICRKCCATYKIMGSIAFHSATMFWLDWSSNENNNNDNNPQIDVIHWGPEFCGFSRCVNSVHFQIFCLSIIIWIENRNRTDKQQNLRIPYFRETDNLYFVFWQCVIREVFFHCPIIKDLAKEGKIVTGVY